MAKCPKTDDQRLEEMQNQPQAVTGDQGSWRNHSLKDQIELDRYVKAKKSAGNLLQGRILPGSARS